MKRIIDHFLKKSIKGFVLLLLVGFGLYLIQRLSKLISPIKDWLTPLIKVAPTSQTWIIVGIMILGVYALGLIIERLHLVKALLMKIPFFRVILAFYYGKIRGGKPALIIALNGEAFGQGIYMGPQVIDIIGKKPKKILSSRSMLPTFPVPATGYSGLVLEKRVLIVVNLSLADWLAYIAVASAREIKPSIKVIPLDEYDEYIKQNKNKSLHNSKKRHT